MYDVTDIQFLGRGARGCAYLGTIEASQRVVVQVVSGHLLQTGMDGTPRFLQHGVPGWSHADDETVVVSLVPNGRLLRPGEIPDARSMFVDCVIPLFRAFDERGLAMVEFDENSVIASDEGKFCLVDVGCTLGRKDEARRHETRFDETCFYESPDDYDRNTAALIGNLIAVYDDSPLDLLESVQRGRLTLRQLFDHPYCNDN